ncbi:TetR/AcrR family transcriptional regulator [Bifidobacterium aquikefiri]|uniref:TetR/AcrR family transcriptional regulator n=2 Tax=Bifidobacterium aquikefiri TaxID=1653207 RepID=UPI0023F41BA9|nr:TetR/AcrR family transcriptional regulator [Bifidobacterium aquikefiri]
MTSSSISSRNRLVMAMSRLLWERGYADTSPHEVLHAAGVGQGSMYHFFAGKHDLALEALRHNVAQSFGGREILEESGSPLDRIERYLRVPRAGTRGCRIGRMTQDPQVFDDPEMIALIAEAFQRQLTLWTGALQEAVDVGELPATVNAEDLARTMVAVIQGGYVLARANHAQLPMDQAVNGIIGVLHALSAEHGANAST